MFYSSAPELLFWAVQLLAAGSLPQLAENLKQGCRESPAGLFLLLLLLTMPLTICTEGAEVLPGVAAPSRQPCLGFRQALPAGQGIYLPP